MNSTPTTIDREIYAVLTALGPILNDSRLDPYLNVPLRMFDADGLLALGTWSSGERALIRWAGALWTGGTGEVQLAYIARLSAPFLYAAIGGLAAYRGQNLPAFDSAGQVTA